MTRPNANAASRMAESAHVRPNARHRSPHGTSWGLGLFSLIVGTGAILVITLTGAGGAAQAVPTAIQVGHQVSLLARGTSTTLPPAQTSSSTSSSTTTTIGSKRTTTVVRPLATVTLHEDATEYDAPGASQTTVAQDSASTNGPVTSVGN